MLRIKLTKGGPTALIKENHNPDEEENPFDEFLASERSQQSGAAKKRIEDYAMEKVLGNHRFRAIIDLISHIQGKDHMQSSS